jgi:predicted dehydrogenase
VRKIRMGMVGGGRGAFIGAIHRIAALMDGQVELVCGAFSSDPVSAKVSGEALYLDDARCYASYQEMFAKEAQLPLGERMDFVAIVTPNHLHFPVARMALECGFDVMSDKPATYSLAEALELEGIVRRSGRLYGLTHAYTGYPLMKEARYRVAQGELGTVKKVVVEYSQGWLASTPSEDNKQAAWRLDPSRAGISCCMGDIGVHAANLAEYVCGEISDICADIGGTVDNRVLDDDGTVLLRFDSGARGVLLASQVSVGEENNLKLRVYGDKASLEWSQQEPNTLWLKYPDRPTEMLRAGVGELSPLTLSNLRTPAGHPEGYLEAFANIYRNFAEQIRARLLNQPVCESALDVPGIDEAIRGMAFIENVVAASRSAQKWHSFSIAPQSQLTSQQEESA